MTLPEYGLFWLAVGAIFHLLYGRPHCRLMRTLIPPEEVPRDDPPSVLERLYQLLNKLWEAVKR
jgi:hypothetical protein